MEAKELRYLHEKAKGTLKRNEAIRDMAAKGENFAEIGRIFKLSRQAVRHICREV